MKEIYNHFLSSNGITTDTRNILPNTMFFALKGENFDGNKFAEIALEKGASCVVVDDKSLLTSGNNNIIVVEDVLKTLQQLANYHRNHFDIPIIGITGSNGKTTTKELIASVLTQQYNLLYTKGNLNNHIGVPLTLLQLSNEHEIAVIEMGANHPGDIKELCDITEPTHGIITNIGKAHLEGFVNFEGVLKTKKELYDALEHNKGSIFVNNDDQVLTSILPTINTVSYSTIQGNVIGKIENLSPFVAFSYKTDTYTSPILHTHLVGSYNFTNFLASIAIGQFFNIPFEKINAGIENYLPTNNRSQVEKTANNTLIIDCYNANPTSMQAAIQSFAQIEAPNKLLILGDMRELGAESHEEHQKVIDLVQSLALKAILVGNEFAKTNHNFAHFINTEEILSSKLNPKDYLILLKGSRGIGLERLLPLL